MTQELNTSPSPSSSVPSQESLEDSTIMSTSPGTVLPLPSLPRPKRRVNSRSIEALVKYQKNQKEKRLRETAKAVMGSTQDRVLSQGQLGVIREFKKTPIISIATKAAGVSRDTFYRWLKENKIFSDLIEMAKEVGNDTAKEGLWSRVTRGDLNAIKYYLEHNDAQYANNMTVNLRPVTPSWRESIDGPGVKQAGVQVEGKTLTKVETAINREDGVSVNQILIDGYTRKQSGEIQAEEIPMGGTQ